MLLFSHLRGYLPQHSNIPIFHHSIIPIFHSSNSFVVIIQLGDNRSIVSTFIFLLNPSTILHHRIIPLSLHNHPLLSPLFHYSTIPFLHTSNSFVVIIQLGDNRPIVSTFIFLLNPPTISHHRIIPLSLHNHPLLSPFFHYSIIPTFHSSILPTPLPLLSNWETIDRLSLHSSFFFRSTINDHQSTITIHRSIPSLPLDTTLAALGSLGDRSGLFFCSSFIVQRSTIIVQRSSLLLF